ncbi:hypothetical protein ACJMK2_000805 [Sinanodonta woodiana]|uniref:USP domain-containing protein n=1 Tax=Sinanodonta woodiana TaxID=1069815 RepID=A0ABD3XSN9_SINWO
MAEKLNTSDCDQCSKAGRKGRLKTCQINFNEAVIICTNALCSFGLESGDTLSRSLSAISLKGKSKDGLCSASQSTCTSHTKSRLPNAGSISGPFIQSSKQPSLSVSSATWGSLHTGLPGVKNLGKDQIIQNFLYQLPLSGKASCNVEKYEGKDSDGSSTATESLCDQENTNSLATTKTYTKLKLKRGFEGFQFNKKDETFSDEDKRKQTEICVNKNTSENKSFSDQPSFVNQNEKLKTSSQNSRSPEFSAIKNTSNSKHITDNKDVFINSTPSCITKNSFAQSDHIPENSDKWKWESFLQWQNKDALCWLDVVLCLLVHNQTLFNLLKDNRCPKESVIFTLLKAYHQAQDLINGKKKCLQRNSPDSAFVQSVLSNTLSKSEKKCSRGHGPRCSSGWTDTSIQTGAGNSPSSLGMLGESLYESPGLAVACKTMEDVREAVWQRLQSKLKCEKGRNDSPVLAFSALVQETLEVKAHFQMRYRFSYTCLGCGEVEESIHENILPSFPNTSIDFSIEKPAHIRKCMKCQQESSRVMTYERLPNTLVMHFAEGLPHNNLTALDLQFQGDYYKVKGVIRYTNNPDHFTAWIRNGTDDTWMECDDLKSPVCRFLREAPNFPPQEIHIVMWEKRPRQGGNAAELSSPNPASCRSTNAKTQLDCQFTKSDHSSSLGKPVLEDHTLKLGWQTSKLAKQSADAHIFRKGGLNKDISCNSGMLGVEARSTKFSGLNSSMFDSQADINLGTVQASAFRTSGHSSSNLVTCKCVPSSDVCACDQREKELPRFVSTAFNRQILLKPTPLHSAAPDQNFVPSIKSLITDDPSKSVSSLEMKRHAISKVSEKGYGVSGASATAVLSKNCSENKLTDFMFVPKAENLNKAAHFSHANTSALLSASSHAPSRQEQNALSLLRSLRKQRDGKVGLQLTGNFKPSGFSHASTKTSREGNIKSVNGDSVSKEINVPKAGKVSDSRKPSGAEQFLSTFGRGRGHSGIGSKFEGLKLSAKNNLDVSITSAITDLRMASPMSSLYSEPVNKRQVKNKLGKQKVLKSSQSNFEGLHILRRNSTQSFDSGETTVCNNKVANISKGHGRKNKQDVTEEKIISSPVDKDLNPAERQTKNIADVYDTNSNELSQNSAGGVHIIQIDGEEGKNSNYLSDMLSKFRENNSASKSTVIIIQNRTNRKEIQNSLEADEVVTCGTLGQPLGSQSCDNEQNGKENKVSPVKTNNGSIKSYSLDLAADLAETENSSPSKKRKIEKEECEILQDLYQALNIPFSDVGNAMTEIVSDVEADMDAVDLFGLNFDKNLEGCDENEEDNKAW